MGSRIHFAIPRCGANSSFDMRSLTSMIPALKTHNDIHFHWQALVQFVENEELTFDALKKAMMFIFQPPHLKTVLNLAEKAASPKSLQTNSTFYTLILSCQKQGAA